LRRRAFFVPEIEEGRSTVPNHLTPEELSKEMGLEREQVISLCLQEGVPIYQGKIDKTLFAAQLQATGVVAPLPLQHH
jgi:hypothetical protein